MDTILNKQGNIQQEIERLYRNIKKDGPSRWTAEYLNDRSDKLERYWAEYKRNNDTLHDLLSADHDYLSGKYFEETHTLYRQTQELLRSALREAPPSTKAGTEPYSGVTRDTKAYAAATTDAAADAAAAVAAIIKTQNDESRYSDGNKLEEMLKKQQSNFKAFGRTVINIDLNNLNEKWEFEDALKSLHSRWSVIDDLHWEIDPRLDVSNSTEYEDLFFKNEQLFNYMKKKINEKLWSAAHRDKSTPQLDIPVFTGNYQQWVSFKDLFCEAVHKNPSLSNAQKMQFLKSKIRGEAERLIQHLQISSENYTASWEILNQRYNNKKLIFTSHMNTLMNLPTMQHPTSHHIKRIHDVTMECLNAIKNLGVNIDTWDPMLIYILSQKLDAETHNEYMSSLKQPRDLPVMEDFLGFLENKFTTMESSRRKQENIPKTSSNNPTTSRQEKSNQYKSYTNYSNKAIAQSNQVTRNRTRYCPVCNSTEHGIYYCNQFLEMSPIQKRQMITKLNFCNNCLFNHYGKACTSNKRCRECNAAHNTIMHETFSKPSNTTPLPTQRTSNSHVAQQGDTPEILLSTAIINVQGKDGSFVPMRALIDQGSQISIITESAAQQLGISRQKCSGVITGVGTKASTCKGKININCSSLHQDYSFNTEVLIMKKLINNLPHYSYIKPNWEFINEVKLADPEFYISRPIDILLGADVYSHIILHGISRVASPGPVAQNTRLGWILCGKAQSMQCNVVLNNIEDIERFWQVEDVSDVNGYSTEDEECMKMYKSTTTRMDNGRYKVRLPLKPNIKELGESRNRAIAQFLQLEKKFNKNTSIATEYKLFIEQYLAAGHMTIADDNTTPEYFMPHHCVIREDSLTTLLRVVFNASQKTSQGTSLNDYMYKGPNLQKDLFELIIRWRQYRIVFTADIEKMFRQIWVHEDDQNYQKIFWRDSSYDLLREYKLTTVTYGTKAAPFLAMMTLRQLAEDERSMYPEAAQVVEECFYMDDLLHGTDSLEKALQLQRDLVQMLKCGGFNLRKWNSNHRELLQDREVFFMQENYTFNYSECTKTLGIHWKPEQDRFIYQSKIETSPSDSMENTKRRLLSDISKLFDPVGWLTPVSTSLKMLFQQVWSTKVQWDDKIPEDINSKWNKMKQDMININKINIPRWLGIYTGAEVELHAFCDASQKAYGCVVYCKIVEKGTPRITLVAGKSKLVPHNKHVSLPRLELCGAHLLSKLVHKIKQCLSNHKVTIYGWVDSTAVLGWLQGNPDRWATFVSNRVRQITAIMPAECWQYVKSSENPADCASRGLTVTQLTEHTLWWEGPTWLPTYKNQDTEHVTYTTNEEIKQEKKVVNVVQQDTIKNMLNNYSSLTKATRVLAWVRRFITKAQNRPQESYLTLKELKQAKEKIIKQVQHEEFAEEIASIKANKNLSSKSKILCLNPFLDNQDILRVGGRLTNANISPDMKNPIILPCGSRLTELIITDAHKLTFHGGPRITLAFIRQKYWLTSGMRTTKKYTRRCVTCKKQNPQKLQQIMGDLPGARVNPSRPFLHTGVDYTGHVFIKANKGRGIKTTKGYIAVFVCMVTKAVHLELVSDLSTSAFIAALRRMAARRGSPSDLYSDNGRNFVGASRILQQEYAEIEQVFSEEFVKEVTDMQINWHFNAPSWPSAGGLFEAAVKSFKYHLKRVIGDQTLTFEEFSTLISQIEAVLNSRPLCALTEDPEDLDYLTPSHFLASGPVLSIVETERDLRTRWQLAQKIFQDIWKRWRSEYLTQLTSRNKWKQPQENVKINDIVVVHDDNLPPGKWLMGRVVDTHPGQDGYVRVVTLKTKNSLIRRPVTKISVLVENQEENQEGNQKENKSYQERKEKQDENKKDRNKKFSLTSLCAVLLFFMTLISNAECNINITKFRDDQGLYFDKIANMRLVKDEWKLVIFYEMRPYWQGITALNNYANGLEKTCTSISVREQCTSLVLQLRHGITELEYYNQLLMSQHLRTRPTRQRVRRGLINAIGNIAGDLFGVLDERFATQYEKDIKLIRENQVHIVKLWKNQTSIMEAENNILKRIEFTMNQQHKIMNQHIMSLERVTSDLKNSIQTNQILNELAIAAIVASNLLNNLKGLQNTLLETITDTHQGRFNLHLLTPEQLSNELSIISSQLHKDVSLPIDNVHSDLPTIYSMLQVKTRMLDDLLIFEIKLPLITRDAYEILKLVPIPKLQDGRAISLVPVSDYIAINIKKDTYITMTQTDIRDCVIQPTTYFCYSQKPEYRLREDKSLCIIINRECKVRNEQCLNLWSESYAINMYMYFCCDRCTVRTMCQDQMTAHQLSGAGLITLGHGCIVKTDSFTLYPYKIHSSEVKISPDLYAPKIAAINNIINLTIPHIHFNNNSQTDLYQDIEQVDSKIQELKKKEDEALTEGESISYHDVHHYVMIYIICGLMALAAALFAIRRVQCRWQVPPQVAEPSYTPPLPSARPRVTNINQGQIQLH